VLSQRSVPENKENNRTSAQTGQTRDRRHGLDTETTDPDWEVTQGRAKETPVEGRSKKTPVEGQVKKIPVKGQAKETSERVK
jgi:hypothetical protein